MIVWSGLGFLAPVITFACALGGQYAFDFYQGEGYYSNNPWAIGLAVFVGGCLSAQIGFFLKKRGSKHAVNPQTGEMVEIKSSHSIFFIPLHWAGVLIAIGGVGIMITQFFEK